MFFLRIKPLRAWFLLTLKSLWFCIIPAELLTLGLLTSGSNSFQKSNGKEELSVERVLWWNQLTVDVQVSWIIHLLRQLEDLPPSTGLFPALFSLFFYTFVCYYCNYLSVVSDVAALISPCRWVSFQSDPPDDRGLECLEITFAVTRRFTDKGETNWWIIKWISSCEEMNQPFDSFIYRQQCKRVSSSCLMRPQIQPSGGFRTLGSGNL